MSAAANTFLGVSDVAAAAALATLAAPGGVALRTADDLMDLLLESGAQLLFSPPAIGEYWPGQGGVYAGQVREDDGTTYHQILVAVKPPSRLDHAAATKWAASLSIDGHSDFTLPTRRGATLLYANLSHLFEKAWHWTSEQHTNHSYAWFCYFVNGNQGTYHVGLSNCARAVRRFIA